MCHLLNWVAASESTGSPSEEAELVMNACAPRPGERAARGGGGDPAARAHAARPTAFVRFAAAVRDWGVRPRW